MPSIDIRTQAPCPEPTLSQGRVMAALAAIDTIRSAGDAAECLERLFLSTLLIGATASLYTVAIPEQGAELSSISLFACDPGFAQQFFDLGPTQNHPWLRFARTHTTPGTGRQVQILSASDAAVIDLARAHGFASYLIVPTIAGSELGRVELLCLGWGLDDSFEGEDQHIVRLLARALAAELHDWISLHLGASLQEAVRLQPRDLLLLALEREGLGTKEISLRTGMSIAAVDSRFQRLNRRLNCPSRKASARRAAEHSLLEPGLPGPETPCAAGLSGAAGAPDAPAPRAMPAPGLHRRCAVPAWPGSGDLPGAPCTPSSARSAWPLRARSSEPPKPPSTGRA